MTSCLSRYIPSYDPLTLATEIVAMTSAVASAGYIAYNGMISIPSAQIAIVTTGIAIAGGAILSLIGRVQAYKLNWIQQELQQWCYEVLGTSEYSSREIATKRILECYNSQSTTLDLSGLQLRSIPPTLDALSQLQDLDLSFNNLDSLPPELGDLSQLYSLDLSRNQLFSLPKEIGKLRELRVLDLSRNQFSSLQKEISELRELYRLNVSVNQLSSLPKEIYELPHLWILEFGSNNFSSPPTANSSSSSSSSAAAASRR